MKRCIVELAIAIFLILVLGWALYPQPTTQIVEVPVEVIKIVEVKVPVQMFSTDFVYFASYDELRAWLDSIELELKLSVKPNWSCQDYAWWLFERAIEDGYLMAKYGIRAETYNAAFERQIEGAHAINATFINNHTYLIEPQGLRVFPDFEIEEVKERR